MNPTPPRHAEAVSAAEQARATLARDGPAPSREKILEHMGRWPDGEPIKHAKTLPPETAREISRLIMADRPRGQGHPAHRRAPEHYDQKNPTHSDDGE